MESFFTEKRKKIVLFFIFALAIFLIIFHFTDTPRVWVDEGIYTNIAESVAFHGMFGMQTESGHFFRFGPLLSSNYPLIYPVAGSFKIFGKGLWQARLPMIIYMFLLVVLFYFFAKKRYGFYPAILSVLMLLSFAPFYGNGRPVQGEVPGLVFLVLGSLLLLYFEKSDFKSKKLAIFAGLFLGLAAATKSLYLILLVAALPFTTFLWFKKIKDKKNTLLLLGTFFIPVFIWVMINSPTFDSAKRIIPSLILQSGNNGGSSLSNTSPSLIETISVNLVRFFSESTPILFFFLFISVVFAFTWRYIKKGKQDFSMPECLIFFVIVLNWLGYLIGTGWYRYFFPAHTLLYLLFPGIIMMLAKSIDNKFQKRIILIIPIVLVLFQFFHSVFLSATSLVVSRTRNSDMSNALSSIPATKKVLFYSTVDAIIFLRGDNYSQYLMIPGVFEAGRKDAITDTSYDFILADDSIQNTNTISPCYTNEKVGKYLLFKKTAECDN